MLDYYGYVLKFKNYVMNCEEKEEQDGTMATRKSIVQIDLD